MARGKERGQSEKKTLCSLVNKAGGCRRKDCKHSHDNRGKQCRSFAEGNPCTFGERCVFLHGQAPSSSVSTTANSHTAGRDPTKPRGRSNVLTEQELKLRRWRAQAESYSPNHGPQTKQSRSRFFREALEHMQADAGSMQSVIQSLASDSGLKRILQLVKEDFDAATDASGMLKSTIVPFFKTISYPKALSSGLLEHPIGTIYNTIFGPGGQYALKLFRFIASCCDTMGVDELESVLAVFSKTLDLNGTALLIDEFRQHIEIFTAALNALQEDQQQGLAFGNARKWLNRAKQRLGLTAQPITEEVIHEQRMVAPRPQFEFKIDFPGQLSDAGPRHDNDSEDIGNIRILPTFAEITCDRPPYLPVLDPSQLHLQGIEGLIDRQFRVYREDVVGPIRDALRAEITTNNHPNSTARRHANNTQRVHCYKIVAFLRLRCNDWHGVVATLAIEQPREVQKLSHVKEVSSRDLESAREAWWSSRKRLQKYSLVCILDPAGRTIFCTVVEVKIRKPIRRNDYYADDSDEDDSYDEAEEERSYQDFTTDGSQARFSLCPAEDSDVPTLAHYFSGLQGRKQLQLIEFPKVMLQSFKPTLEALQMMKSTLDVPFADLLVHTNGSSDEPGIGPPEYAQTHGFRYDLSCLLTNGQSLTLSPREEFDIKALTGGSTLDDKQAEALVNSLSRRLALCQGPPGTGKSYTALALTRALLANKDAADLGTMLIVTYTNHALDQDLEHCLENGIKRIIRIGSRSKSERLQNLNLRWISKSMERTRPEMKERYSRRSEMESNSRYVDVAIRQLLGEDSPDPLKGYLQDNYPEYHEQFWGIDSEGFQIKTFGTRSILETWLRGRLGTASDRLRIRSAIELIDENVGIRDMVYQERRALYEFWMNECSQARLQNLMSALKTYRESKRSLDMANEEVDLRCLEEANIIGVTTSGLARHFNLLKRLPIKALLVEEAGEVLEAHTLTAFLPSLEHAILIGDHLQLKPSVNNFNLSSESHQGRKYSLDMSLFERLVSPPPGLAGNKLPFSTLETQRRMHPSISALIRRTLYPRLIDAPNVSNYPEVVGMKHRLFWFDHDVPEVGAETDELVACSKSNDFEVEMTACLVAHILAQGVYNSQDIAVITPYLGQLFKLRMRLSSQFEIVLDDRDVDALEKEDMLDGVGVTKIHKGAPKTSSLLQTLKVATVDNFQGEEAKVVIVSLVRSNKDNKCGFLKTPNRINVLLSRAQHGMYIIGNTRTSAGVPMWSDVIGILKEQGNIGKSLPLRCTRHPDTEILVSDPDDFTKYAPEGGCQLRCGKRLEPCGHACEQKCHSDLRHKNVVCLEACNRPKPGCEHVCLKPCGETCDPICKEILKDINLVLPCGHIMKDMRCYEYQAKDSFKCMVAVEKTVSACQHPVKVRCHIDVDDDKYFCRAACGGALPCGHECKTTCSRCRREFQGKHGKCTQICGRNYSNCNHKCESVCHSGTPCGLCRKPCEVACSHSKCNRVCSEPCTPCAKAECESSCPHSKCSMPCGAPCDFIPCSRRCDKVLDCGHQCPSLCGEVCPPTTYCQQCGSAKVLSMVVDYLEMKTYKEVDLNEDAVVIPACGHAILMSNMDSNVEMSKVYDMNADGTVKAIKPVDPFPAELKDFPGCPICRGSLRGINRYGRLVRRVLLDESTKRFITWAGTAYGPLVERFYTAQKQLSESKSSPLPNTVTLPFHLALTGSREEQFKAINILTKGWDRYDNIKSIRSDIAKYYVKVHKDMTPFASIWRLVEVARRRAGHTTTAQLPSPVSQVSFHIIALSLLIRCDILLLADFVNELGKVRQGPIRVKLQLDFSKNRDECNGLLVEALNAKDYERAVEGCIFFARYCAIEIPCMTNPAVASALKTAGAAHIQSADALCKAHDNKLASLVSEVKDVERSLNGGTFMQTVSSEERRAVLAAMAKEFRGTGHWYTCRNGHPFSIGECGMPMQMARCPQCGENVGGSNHRPVAGVSRADELERELRDMHLDR